MFIMVQIRYTDELSVPSAEGGRHLLCRPTCC